MAHCASCHETFSTVGNFDRHRVGKGHCKTTRQMKAVRMRQNAKGTWLMEDERDVTEFLKKDKE